jgi:hypothetical protein
LRLESTRLGVPSRQPSEAGGWWAAGVDAAKRLTFHVPGDRAEVHPGRGSW